jgi:hypothetical protein
MRRIFGWDAWPEFRPARGRLMVSRFAGL